MKVRIVLKAALASSSKRFSIQSKCVVVAMPLPFMVYFSFFYFSWWRQYNLLSRVAGDR